MPDEIERIILGSLLSGASSALEEVADELTALREGWADQGADPEAVAWLDGLVTRLGWWAGRLAGEAGTDG